jgi:prophage tail gpP-like protein
MTVNRDNRAESPRLHVNFLGREFSGPTGPETFEVTSTLTNIYDGWSLDLPVGAQGLNEEIPNLNIHRWIPITIQHADPAVGSGKAIPMVMGVCTGVKHRTSGQASTLRLTGYDLGKLLDSCAKPWIRLRGVDFGTLIDKLLEPSWRASSRSDGWGIQGITGLFRDQFTKLGRRVSQGRADAVLAAGGVAFGSYMPPIQTEVGESIYDVVARYARLTGLTKSQGSFVSCSADGYIQIFNPDDYKDNDPLYVFNDTNDGQNIRIKSVDVDFDGEDLYTEYDCYGSVVQPPVILNPNKIIDPNFGRFFGQALNEKYLGTASDPIVRRLTFSDQEQYAQGYARVRAEWRKKQSLYKELSIRLTIEGHSMPGPDGQWRPIVEGNIAELHSTRHRINDKFMIEQVVKRQNDTVGTESELTLRRIGLLGA